jgi:putative MFS transporter
MMGAARNTIFLFGAAMLSLGVILHLPMMASDLIAGRHLMAMGFDNAMIAGMAMILVGTLVSGLALWRRVPKDNHDIGVSPPLRIGLRHWLLIIALVSVLVVDTMKPATLGFAMPGMSAEYRLERVDIAWFPFSALTGTVIGSVLWGWFADHQGRRAAILLSTLMFIGTSICGAMPGFGWNIFMCFLMGASAGGLLPVAYALLTELLPVRRRGFFLVLVGGLGSAGGFFAASGFASLLEPTYGWRVLWLIGMPTGIIVLALSLWLPESPAYLVRVDRLKDARASVAAYGGSLVEHRHPEERHEDVESGFGHYSILLMVLVGLLWGLTNFGFLMWLPMMLNTNGVGVAASSSLLAASSFVAFLTIFPATILYQRLGGAVALLIALVATAAGLALIATTGPHAPGILMVLVGVNAVIAMLLPYAAECAPARTRGRATGFVAAGSKAGGLIAQAVTIAGLAPGAEVATFIILVPLLVLIAVMALARRQVTRAAGSALPAHNSPPAARHD